MCPSVEVDVLLPGSPALDHSLSYHGQMIHILHIFAWLMRVQNRIATVTGLSHLILSAS